MSELVSRMFQRMSQIRPKPLEWAWDGLVPMGKLTLLTGDPGVGKSLVSLQVASMVSRGVSTTVPKTVAAPGSAAELVAADSKRVLRRGVLVFSGLDQPEETVLPRLMAAGADPSQVFFFKGFLNHRARICLDQKKSPQPNPSPRKAGARDCPSTIAHGHFVNDTVAATGDKTSAGVRPFRLSRDLGELQSSLEELAEEGITVGLIVIDSIDQYLGANEKKSERIEAVSRLADLAAQSGAAVLVTANSSLKAGSRGGTVVYQELFNVARSVLTVVPDQEDSGRRRVLSLKHNLTARPAGVSFSLDQAGVRWAGEPIAPRSSEDLTAATGLNEKRPLIEEGTCHLGGVTQWLKDLLSAGEASSDSIEHRATQAGISHRMLKRALKTLDCKVRKHNGEWFRCLPDPSEARCANVTDSRNGVPARASVGSLQELELELLGIEPGGELAGARDKALVS